MLKSQKHKRNDPCPCKSGKKLKHCCLEKVKRIQAGVDVGKSQAQIMNEELFENHS